MLISLKGVKVGTCMICNRENQKIGKCRFISADLDYIEYV